MVRLQIKGAGDRRVLFQQVRDLVGRNRLYSQGTDLSLYANLRDREEADLIVANLQAVGVSARILPDG